MLHYFKNKRRKRLREAPFPSGWLRIVEKNFPLYQRLPAEDRLELLGHIQVFLAEKHFEGCGGLDLTDEIKVTIAAQACLLLLHRNTNYYPRLLSILVYPSAYIVRDVTDSSGGIEDEEFDVLQGEAWAHGAVVLSWDAVRRGAADFHDGQNVTLHEFAHQLDQEDGAVQGAPVLEHRSRYVTWARVLGEAFEKLQRATELGRPTVLDEYGATDPAEFFAVATESFFENPAELKRKHPELYEELKAFYRQDPVTYR
ncbi:MAG: M90 family metallopeptidase [Candidatus Latescibacterota bacterium]